jgi:hypothetical protein
LAAIAGRTAWLSRLAAYAGEPAGALVGQPGPFRLITRALAGTCMSPIVQWATKAAATQFSDAVIAALTTKHPEVAP